MSQSKFYQQHVGDVVLTEQQIADGVTRVAQSLEARFEELVVISVTPGGTLFTGDLLRALNIDVKMDYISCPHTPGHRDNQSTIVYHQNIDIEDKDVLIVDDAVESGGTMKRLVAHVAENYQPRSVTVATLFVKPSRVDVAAEVVFGYEMQSDDLLVGYGLPWQDKLRNLPFVAKLKR